MGQLPCGCCSPSVDEVIEAEPAELNPMASAQTLVRHEDFNYKMK